MAPLLAPQETYAAVERPMSQAKECKERRRVNVIVDVVGVQTVGDIVDPSSQSPTVTFKGEFFFNGRIHSQEIRETMSVRPLNKPVKLINGAEGIAASPQHGAIELKPAKFPKRG